MLNLHLLEYSASLSMLGGPSEKALNKCVQFSLSTIIVTLNFKDAHQESLCSKGAKLLTTLEQEILLHKT